MVEDVYWLPVGLSTCARCYTLYSVTGNDVTTSGNESFFQESFLKGIVKTSKYVQL